MSQQEDVPDIYGQVHPHETPELIREKLLELETGLDEIPAQKKVGLLLAKEKCPELLNDGFKLMFLRCDCFRVKDAAKRLAKFWDSRREICEDDEIAFRPLTIDGLLQKNDHEALKMALCQIVPNARDPSGRRILFMDSSRQDHKLISVKSQARVAAYTVMAMLEDETTQQKGIVVLFWPYKETWDQPNREFISLMGASVRGALPVRLSASHVCQPPAFFRLLIPLIKLVMGERLRKRIRFHTGSNDDVQKSLAPFGLTKEILPTELGGDIVLDQQAWIEERRKAGK